MDRYNLNTIPKFNHQGTKKESTDLDRILKDDTFEHLVVSTKFWSTSKMNWSFWAFIKL